MSRTTPVFVIEHFIKRVVEGDRWGSIECKHCDYRREYVRDTATSISIYFLLAVHLLEDHRVVIGPLGEPSLTRPVSIRQREA